MLIVVLRTLFFYFFLLVILRVMGKRELGALGPLDLVVTIIMAEVATVPIENPNRPISHGVVPIITIFLIEMVLSYLCLKCDRMRHIISGRPSVVIRNGQLVRSEMRWLRYSVLDLMEQLRIQGYFNLADVEMAILESDGELSVMPKTEKRPVTVQDLDLAVRKEHFPYAVVVDGKIDDEALRDAGLDEVRLLELLRAKGISGVEKVFIALYEGGNLYVQQR